MQTKPFLKWAGCKFRLLDIILPSLPKGDRLVEPFVGSGAVFLNASYQSYILCDCNSDLISLFKNIQSNGNQYINYCKSFFTNENNNKEIFYKFRYHFNESTDFAERGALFLYLNRHAFNGLIRYNTKGEYNAPFGKYKKPYFPQAELDFFYQKTQSVDVSFMVQDFQTTFSTLKKGDVVYADPPYSPLSTTANFTAYAKNSFAQNEQKHLAQLAEHTAKKGVPVVVSNHDTPFTRELYAGAALQHFAVQRFISCNGAGRLKAPELLAAYL